MSVAQASNGVHGEPWRGIPGDWTPWQLSSGWQQGIPGALLGLAWQQGIPGALAGQPSSRAWDGALTCT